MYYTPSFCESLFVEDKTKHFEEKSVILVEPTSETYTRCIWCGSRDSGLNQNLHCLMCAEKNRIFNAHMVMKGQSIGAGPRS